MLLATTVRYKAKHAKQSEFVSTEKTLYSTVYNRWERSWTSHVDRRMPSLENIRQDSSLGHTAWLCQSSSKSKYSISHFSVFYPKKKVISPYLVLNAKGIDRATEESFGCQPSRPAKKLYSLFALEAYNFLFGRSHINRSFALDIIVTVSRFSCRHIASSIAALNRNTSHDMK